MVRRNYKKPHRAKKKKPILAKAAFWRSAFFTVAIGGSVWLVCFSPALEVKEISVAGAQKISGDECVEIIRQAADKKIAFLDSKSILLLNLDKTKKELLEKFPQIQDIKIVRQFPSKIYASIEERRGVAVLAAANGKRYLVDGDGLAFEEIAQIPDGLLKITDARGQDPRLGGEAINKNLLSNILRIAGGSRRDAGIQIIAAAIAASERVNLETSEGWLIYFNPVKDVDSQLLKLAAVLADEGFKEKRPNLEYVDVRFTRVYLKQKTADPQGGAEMETEANSRGPAAATP